MVSFGVWKNRYKKFLDNPIAVVPFIKKRFYYNRIADAELKNYKNFQYLDYNKTIDLLISGNKSIVRFGDEIFDMIQGIGLYYGDWRQKYNPALAKRLKEVLSSDNDKLLVCFNPELILKTKEEFSKMGIPEQYHFWTNSKIFMKNYYHPNKVYGSALCFNSTYNQNIDYKKILVFLATKHIIVVTSNTARFGNYQFGKSTSFVEAPQSDAWDSYDDLLKKTLQLLTKYPQDESLVMVSMGSAAKVMSYDLTEIGYSVWDTGQFFDLAYQKIKDAK